jgi:hypothetical protein
MWKNKERKPRRSEPMNLDQKGRWQELSEEIMSGMQEWRIRHPHASLGEIEAALDERLWRLRARLLEDVAQTSEAATGGGGTAVCLVCGGAGPDFSPLDEELGILAGSLTPRLHEQVVRLGSWIPSFRQAAAVLSDFSGVHISELPWPPRM